MQNTSNVNKYIPVKSTAIAANETTPTAISAVSAIVFIKISFIYNYVF